MSTTKPSNPKEAFGDSRVPMDLAPDTAIGWMNMAFLEGALKYGKYNWRITGVKTSTYIRAMKRHIAKYANGRNVDPKTKVHELASVMACCAIILDSEVKGNLIDDRQPKLDMGKFFEDLEKVVAHLKEEFKDFTPTQFTELEHGESAQVKPIETTVDSIKVYNYRDENYVAMVKAIREVGNLGLKEAVELARSPAPFQVPIEPGKSDAWAKMILSQAGASL